MIPHGAELHFQWPGMLELLFRATLILAAAWAVHFALGGVNPRWRVTLWRAVSASLLLLPLTSAISVTFPVELADEIMQAGGFIFTPEAQEGAVGFWRGVSWLEIVWLAGTVFSLLLLGRSHIKLTRQVKSLPRADEAARELLTSVAQGVGYAGPLPDLKFSRPVEVPFACGVLKPVVVLPESMLAPGSESELPAVLAHEVSHLRAADLAWNFMAQVVRCLLWFHPFARPVPGAHRAACEDVCNAAAAEYVGDVAAYSKTLARVALATINSPVIQGGIPMANRATVLRRLDFLNKGISARPLTNSALGMFVLLACIALSGMSGLGLAAVPAKQSSGDQAADSSDYLMMADIMPKIKSMPKRPEMPSQLVKAMVAKGDTIVVSKLDIFVDENGDVNRELTRVRNTPSYYPELNQIALEWVLQMKFQPAMIAGTPVKVRMTIPVQWKTK